MIAFLDPLSIQVKDLYRDDLTDLKTPITYFDDASLPSTIPSVGIELV